MSLLYYYYYYYYDLKRNTTILNLLKGINQPMNESALSDRAKRTNSMYEGYIYAKFKKTTNRARRSKKGGSSTSVNAIVLWKNAQMG